MIPVEAEGNLTLAGKFDRLRHRLKDPQWRRFGLTLLAGKMLALALLMVGILAFSYYQKSSDALADTAAVSTTGPSTQPAAAAAAPDPYATTKGGDLINPINTVWTLLGAFL